MYTRTKVVATVNPSSEHPLAEGEPNLGSAKELIRAGADVLRVNLSHASPRDCRKIISEIKKIRRKYQTHTAILFDTKGPELRLSPTIEPVTVVAGQQLQLTNEESDEENVIKTTHLGKFPPIKPETVVYIDDGKIRLRVEQGDDALIKVTALNPGILIPAKRVEIAGVDLQTEILSDDDKTILADTLNAGIDFVAVSFVQKASDVHEVRKFTESIDPSVHLIAKIETDTSVRNLAEIIDTADGVMVARGDLGLSIPISKIPVVQKEIIQAANKAGKPVITATQMLESMISSPNPSRADASDIANAVLDGTDALMLSAETAIGKYPKECIQFLKETALEAEKVYDYQKAMDTWKDSETGSIAEAVSYAAVTSASSIKASAIITSTESGSTSRRIARHRPATQIIAVSHNSKTLRQLSLVRGVKPVLGKELRTLDDQLNEAVLIASSKGYINSEDLVVVVAGVLKDLPTSTNLLNVRLAAKIILSGQGIGNKAVVGRAVIVDSDLKKKQLSKETVAVISRADFNDAKYYRNCAGIVAESPGLTCEAALISRECQLPVVCGATDATTLFQDGQKIAVNAADGHVYILD